MRSSSFICLANIVSILVMLRYFSIRSKKHPLQGIQLVMEDRYKASGPSEGLESIQIGTWTHWLPFVLGPLPQVIKFASCKGFSWTKASCFSFLMRWIALGLGNLNTHSAKSTSAAFSKWECAGRYSDIISQAAEYFPCGHEDFLHCQLISRDFDPFLRPCSTNNFPI
jgi:hypothetical protein